MTKKNKKIKLSTQGKLLQFKDYRDKGLKNKEISQVMNVSERTVRSWQEKLRNEQTVLPPAPKKRKMNDFTGIDVENTPLPKLFDYQQEIFNYPDGKDIFILKARQIGFSYGIALWNLVDALTTGKDKIFISASIQQARILSTYIFNLAFSIYKVKMQGQKICEVIRSNGQDTVTLAFCANNSSTAQGHHGDLIFDEFAWIPKCEQVLQTASAMATQKDYRVFYISTPSSTSHLAYRLWQGLDEFGNSVSDTDGIVRKQYNLQTAINQGCDLIDIAKLRQRHSERDFKLLFEGVWLDDATSVFKLEELLKCAFKVAKETVELPKFNFADGECILGIDPNAQGPDLAGFAVIQYSKKARVHHCKSKYCPTERSLLERTLKLVKKYQPTRIICDITGVGRAFWSNLKKQPFKYRVNLQGLNYTQKIRKALVEKLIDLVNTQQIEFDGTDTHLLHSFMAIKNSYTKHGFHTFIAERATGIGHADAFWAIAHAVIRFKPQAPNPQANTLMRPEAFKKRQGARCTVF